MAGWAERLEVTGVVQGVGFRPFVNRLANELGLRGHVGNDSTRVFIEVVGERAAVDELVARLRSEAPPLARIDEVTRGPGGLDRGAVGAGFTIVASEEVAGPRTVVPPDTAVCDDCLAELWDPADRRHRHPFITCTNCGPRFTIITGLPYDRANTTMAAFELCPACEAEYHDPVDRRHHAQPIGCHDCGPTLRYHRAAGSGVDGGGSTGEAALAEARAAIEAGRIVAVKGLGGFHLACDATDEAVVARLRARKHRPDKPFAVLVADLAAAGRIALVDDDEAALLTSPARPVVLLRARAGSEAVAPSVAPGNPLIGVMVAYTPTHHLLVEGWSRPLVMTSGNLAGEPIAHRDADGVALLDGLADGLLTNDRPIVAPCDDSVVRSLGRTLLPIRRARGYAPLPVPFGRSGRAVLATGGELKNTVCVASAGSRDGPGRAWVSQHIGDLGSLSTLEALERTAQRLGDLYDVDPEVVAIDAHPGYTASRWARRRHPGRLIEIQHHHAHVASVMAERGLPPDQAVLGFAFDGTGYGDDGTIWGGEVLLADASGYRRLAHLVPVPLPGGDAAIEQPWRVALSHLRAAGVAWDDDLAPVRALGPDDRALFERQLATGVGCVDTTSMGRLFDAVASTLGLRQVITYEAQAAIELEVAARRNDGPPRSYRFAIDGPRIDPRPVLSGLVDDLRAGHPVEAMADGFHHAVADLVVRLVAELPVPAELDRDGVDDRPVVLSGGVFQNALLTGRILEAMAPTGRTVHTHRIVPPNDGGLALGQAWIAAHRTEPPDGGAIGAGARKES